MTNSFLYPVKKYNIKNYSRVKPELLMVTETISLNCQKINNRTEKISKKRVTVKELLFNKTESYKLLY